MLREVGAPVLIALLHQGRQLRQHRCDAPGQGLQQGGQFRQGLGIILQQLIDAPAVLLPQGQLLQLGDEAGDLLPLRRSAEAHAAAVDLRQQVGLGEPRLGCRQGLVQAGLKVRHPDVQKAEDHELCQADVLPLALRLPFAEEIRQRRVLRLLRAEILHLLEAAADRLHLLPLLAAEQQAVFPKKLRLPALHRDPVDPLIHGLNGLIEDHRLPQHKVCHLAFPPHAVRLSPSVVPGPGPAFCWIDLFPILARAFRGCQSAVAPDSAPRRGLAGRTPIGRTPHSPPCANASGLL